MNADRVSDSRTRRSSSLTIADLVGDPSLDTHLVAGADGVRRTVLWAHSCEMRDPGRWLGPHELLMTMGTPVPAGSEAQREFIARLDGAQLAGMTVGESLSSPRYTKALLAEADERGFPVLFTGPETPFAAIGRTVAAANADEHTTQVLMLSRLYRLASTQDRAGRRSGRGLRDVFGAEIRVVDDATGCVLIGDGVLAVDDAGGQRHQLRTVRASHLLLDRYSRLDGFSLVHLRQVLEVDTNSIAQEAHHEAAQRAELLDDWLGERDLAGVAAALARRWGRRSTRYRVASAVAADPARVHLALALSELPVLSVDRADHVAVAFRESDLDAIRPVLLEVAERVGVSEGHGRREDVGLALAEATAALHDAEPAGTPWGTFDGHRDLLVTRSRRETRALLAAVLGPLAGDEERMVGLRTTLFAFLDRDLSWTATAQHLGIHRQTLVYRLQQVELVTGRGVRSTRSIAELWLARLAWSELE